MFEVKESTVGNPDGSVRVTRTTKVTGKGQQYFINKFVFPAPAGVIPLLKNLLEAFDGFPRTCGGDPQGG